MTSGETPGQNAVGVEGDFHVARCLRCTAVFVEDPPAPSEIHRAYATGYYSFDAGSGFGARLTPRVLRLRRRLLTGRYRGRQRASLLQRLARLVPGYPTRRQPGRALDVGCGSGERLHRLAEAGWSVAGVEPDDAAVERGRAAGLDLRVGLGEDLPFEAASVDAVIMSHSIEHCHAPRVAVREAARVLRDGGELVITTPNERSLARHLFGTRWAHWDLPRHTVLLNPASLQQMLVAEGFGVESVRGSSLGYGWAQSLLSSTSRRGAGGGRVPVLLRVGFAALGIAVNLLPWSDEIEVIGRRRSRAEDGDGAPGIPQHHMEPAGEK